MDNFDLSRFVDAQDPLYAAIRRELASGAKRSHWMWFVFPQIRGLGHSPTAQFYAISSRAEALAYLSHAVLGARLRECTELVNAVPNRSAHTIFGTPDDLKFRSSMTLFHAVAPHETLFRDALEKYFAGEPDTATLGRL